MPKEKYSIIFTLLAMIVAGVLAWQITLSSHKHNSFVEAESKNNKLVSILAFKIDVAENGKEALQKLKEKSFDLILMDC